MSLRKTTVIPIATLYQVPCMGLLLSPLHNQKLTFIEHLLVPGQALSVISIISWNSHPTTQCKYHSSPLTQEEMGLREGKEFAQGQICSSLSLQPLPCSASHVTPSVPGACLRGADPVSYGDLNILDSAHVASYWRQWLYSEFVRNSTFEISEGKTKLNPKSPIEGFVRTCHT